MSLQTYAFKHRLTNLELMVRARSEEAAVESFGNYINFLDTHTHSGIKVVRRIEESTLTATGFKAEGIINGSQQFVAPPIPPVDGPLALKIPDAASYASSTDLAGALNITGSMSLIWHMRADDYSFIGYMGSKTGTTAGSFAWSMQLVQRALHLTINTGSAFDTAVSDVIPAIDGEGIWCRATFNSSSEEVDFYTSDQDSDTPQLGLNWTFLNTDTMPGIDGILANTGAPVTIPGLGGAGGGLTGEYVRFMGIVGLSPTLVPLWDMNPADYDKDVSQFTFVSPTSSLNETWSLINGATVSATDP